MKWTHVEIENAIRYWTRKLREALRFYRHWQSSPAGGVARAYRDRVRHCVKKIREWEAAG